MKKFIIATILMTATITTSAPAACSLAELTSFLDKDAVLFNHCKIQVINNNKILLCSGKDFELEPITKDSSKSSVAIKPTTKTQIQPTSNDVDKTGQMTVKKTDIKQLFNSF